MSKIITQKRAVFYVLLKEYQRNHYAYVPAWRFVGELDIPEIGESFFMSYKCPANGVNLFFENPDLIDRRMTTGKSGAQYYEYHLKHPFVVGSIKDKKIREFYYQLGYEESKPVDDFRTIKTTTGEGGGA